MRCQIDLFLAMDVVILLWEINGDPHSIVVIFEAKPQKNQPASIKRDEAGHHDDGLESCVPDAQIWFQRKMLTPV